MIGNLYANTRMSQKDRILLHLVIAGGNSNKECNEIYGFRHLPSIIRYLRNDNIKIINEHNGGKDRFGGSTYWVNYTLAPSNEQTPEINKKIADLKKYHNILQN